MLDLNNLNPGEVIYDTRKKRTFRTVCTIPGTGRIWGLRGLYTRKSNGTTEYIKHLEYWKKVTFEE